MEMINNVEDIHQGSHNLWCSVCAVLPGMISLVTWQHVDELNKVIDEKEMKGAALMLIFVKTFTINLLPK